MKIQKNKDHILFTNSDGEYHMSLTQFRELGEEKAKEYANTEIQLKKNSNYNSKTINFEQARKLGFCEYGIKDFCGKLNLDINKNYQVETLLNCLTIKAFLSYPQECFKLFGKTKTVDKFGGIKRLLSENKISRMLCIVLENKFLDETTLHLLACDFAESSLSNFEVLYPDDSRPRLAIEAKRRFINGEISREDLLVAWLEAKSAAWSEELEAKSAAWSAAKSAAWSAVESAAWSAKLAAESAAKSAAESAAIEYMCDLVLEVL